MKTVIELAREAGLRDCTCNGTKGCLARFVELVRADERGIGFDKAELWLKRINDAVLAEREACAKVCDELLADVPPYTAPDCAAAIRDRTAAIRDREEARGNK